MTLKGSSSQACAACKYQRRKCSTECPLAPYFPPDQTKMFHNAHKLFGVKNIIKMLKKLDATQKKKEAMRSIIYQAYIRDRYPVHGCLGVINQLQLQIRQTQEEHHQHLGMAPPTFDLFAISNALPVSQHHSSNSNITNASSSSLDSEDCLWVHHLYATATTHTNTNTRITQGHTILY